MSSNANKGRRRSGVWNTGSTDADTDVVGKEKESRRHRWTPGRKEPAMYEDHLNSNKKRHRASGLPSRSRTLERRPSMPLRSSSTAVSSETPEDAPEALGFGMEHRGADESTTSLERPFTPSSATPDQDRPRSSSKTRRALERVTTPASKRSGSFSVASALLGRSRSRHKPKQDSQTSMAESEEEPSRPRTATMESRIRNRSQSRNRSRSRHEAGSVHAQSSPISQGGAEYLASVPVSTHQPSAPSISSVGSPVRSPSPRPGTGTRSISPMSSGTADSITSALPSANARRILHLMKTLNGRMSGNVVFRRGFGNPWSQSYCYINDESGSLMYESRGSEGAHKTLVPELRGSSVRSNLDGDVPYLELSFPDVPDEVHVKLQTQSDFDAWFAALLHWTPRGDVNSASSSDHQQSDSEMGMTSQSPSTTDLVREDLARKRGGSLNETANIRDRAASKASNKSEHRRSIIGGATKENPVIKIGKMIYWDTNVGYNNTSGLGQPSTARPSTGRMMSMASRRWRRISGQLRENGELKLHSDADNSLISIVQLSQLSRCAIQRLDSSVLDNDFCIAIYPQYTSSFSNTQPGFIRPIFLSLENRVLFEVWFVLLRAFTMPSIYGPRIDNEDSEFGDDNQDLESMIATSTTYTFRMERSLSVRIGEAKMQSGAGAESSFTSGFGKNQNQEKHGYYAEVLLDNEPRGKTVVKYQGSSPLWGESFEFQDLPPVLSNASVLVKRRPPEQPNAKDHSDKSHGPDVFGQQQDGYTNLANDVVCGKVEIQMEELEPEKEIEKWWPVSNMHGQRVGELLIKVRADEGIILMARDYKKLDVMLHRFSNMLTLHIAQTIPTELKRLSDSLLNIFQVSGKAGDWIMALVEEEIDGSQKETPITRLRYSRRPSNEQADPNNGLERSDRETIVRDLNKNATLEANLLFRGNTLLTKSLDTHMRRVGKEYLEESLAAKLQEINDKNEDCEVDPNRVNSPSDLDRNWRRLLLCTQDVWKGVVANKSRCPVELRIIFRHIRACAEDRYGDFLRSVSYSSVSGFLFLRFFCPAVLNPKLFGLLKDDLKPRARRTFTLIAKSLQTMANMASFGTKEPWMEPMNVFLVQHRESFKTFIDDVCFVPAPLSGASYPNAPNSPTYPPGVVSAEQHLSYTTPMTIMQRLPPSSREGFPSLPYLIDQARSFADLIHLWLEAVMALSNPSDSATLPGKTHSDILDAIMATEGELGDFHVLCEELNTRTQECLNRAERAERPDSPHSFQWEDVINQLQKAQIKNSSKEAFDNVAAKIASDPSMLPDDGPHAATIDATMRQLRSPDEDGDDRLVGQGPYSDSTLAQTEPTLVDSTPRSSTWGRPGSVSHASSFQGSSSRGYAQSVQDSPGQSASTSAVSSDTEHTTTALPNYDREVRHRERREMARFQIQKQVEAAQSREKEKSTQKEKKKMTSKLVPSLMKMKKDKHKDQERQSFGFATKSNGSAANGSAANGNEYGGMI